MPDEQKTVFISYRRDAAKYIALLVYKDLIAHGYDTFIDIESIDSGQFARIILRQIEARAHFVVILTTGTVDRCAEPGDWLRREIEYAMEKQRNIVPLLMSGFTFKGTEPCLTGKLAELSGYNGLTVPDEYFDAAMEKLRTRYLKQPVYGAIKAVPVSDQSEVRRKIEQANAEPKPTKEQLSAEEYFNRAYQKAISGDLDGAIADFDEAIRLNPQYSEAYNNRGIVYGSNDNFDSAIADFDEAIRLNPQFADAYNNRGYMRYEKGDLNGAIADYDEAIRLNPSHLNAYGNRGGARFRKGDLIGGLRDYWKYSRSRRQVE